MDRDAAAGTVRQVVRVVRANHITFMAGSIAHSAFLSLLPLLLLVLVISTAIGEAVLTEHIVDLARTYLSPTGEALVYEALRNASDRAGASLFGVITLLWGMLRVFRGVSTAFDELYGESYTGLVEQVADGVVVFVVIVGATAGTGLVITLLAGNAHPVVRVFTPIVLLAGLVVAFYPMYYLFPDPEVGYVEAVPGTVVAAVGWVVLEMVFGLYVALVDTVGLFGLLGSVILLLIWLYGVSFVLLTGAAVNLVLAGRHREEDATGDVPDEAIDDDPVEGRST